MASISGSFLYGLVSCESNGLIPDLVSMLARTRYLRHVVLLQTRQGQTLFTVLEIKIKSVQIYLLNQKN